MTIREELEQREQEILVPWASLSRESKGRLRDEVPCDIRPAFQRDRDRILHSKSFRRLKDKTQVFLAPAGDHYRTRLTHTLEVSQNARTIAKALRLNEDLVEAIALGHDLGHTPFGHAGERALNRICPLGFRHNEQSLRLVDVLERDGKRVNTSTQFVSWRNDDPFTRRLLSDEGMHFMEFSREAKAIFMAVQMLSLERPEVMVRETVREERQETVKQKGRYKKVRKTSMVRVIRLTEAAVESLGPRGHHVITCPNWGVAGHWRHYKSGKAVWVKPYRKGRERRNPEAYQPKEYALPKEI